jgi:hypothetical protein
MIVGLARAELYLRGSLYVPLKIQENVADLLPKAQFGWSIIREASPHLLRDHRLLDFRGSRLPGVRIG